MHRAAGLCLALALPLAAGAAGSVYKWVDAQGVVHFDDQSRLAERLTRQSIARRFIAGEATATAPAELVTEVQRRCADLRERAASMAQSTTLYGRDPAGNVYRLSERQMALERADADQARDYYCRDDAARLIYQELLAVVRADAGAPAADR
ncbi:DUF4124 domain-containing protein [Stagnimonas aquatica]|uniref:DUF4124 domain-containing protein n=1 Tax=Stagnimonas aquatica TaxID=2689987 RepID=A0A3N0VL82_9GAMM|nr:DUF4124 domain-containing protein [Stagnimonas aquatica]ROH93519.1 DUF4124 domain-containing protein [Stagnimonas aquatica]